jgi:WhiB family redox-sensing transcriptional regulator
MIQLDTLLMTIAGAPALPGARCRGRHHLFDEQNGSESSETAAARHRQALGLCQHCPALTACRAWLDTLPARKRPQGVVAGTIGGTDAPPV